MSRVDPGLDARLRRLERLAALDFLQLHGLAFDADIGVPVTNAEGETRIDERGNPIYTLNARVLRQQAGQDIAAILREHQDAPVETRDAA